MNWLIPFLIMFAQMGDVHETDVLDEGFRIEMSIVVNHPVEVIWDAFVKPEHLVKWLAPKVEVDFRLNGMWKSNYNPAEEIGDPSTIHNRIISYDPYKMISLKVDKAPENFPFKVSIDDTWTVIYLEKLDDNKTKIICAGMGYDDNNLESSKMKDFFIKGNLYTLKMLANYLDETSTKNLGE